MARAIRGHKGHKVQPLGRYFSSTVVVQDQTPPEAVADDPVRVHVTVAAVPAVKAVLAPFPKVPLRVTAPSEPNAEICGYPSPVTDVLGMSDTTTPVVTVARIDDALTSLKEHTVGPNVALNVLRPSARQTSTFVLSAPSSLTARATWALAM